MLKHLKESNMNYFSHWLRSMKFAAWSAKMYFACIFHATFPWIFTNTFSISVLQLAKDLEEETNAKY
jgi:hypothetical protein